MTSRTARYYTIGKLTKQTQNIWFCLHGFGQSVQHFSHKFLEIADDQTFVIVPEALSRFYLDTRFEKVGASWLTFEVLDHEIDDFVDYLDTLYKRLVETSNASQLRITILGFSQGAAVACRWINLSNLVSVDRLILWSGWFPNGFNQIIEPGKLAAVDCYYIYGYEDEYLAKIGNTAHYLQRMTDEIPNLKIVPFNGRHQLDTDTLNQLFKH